MAKIVLRVRPDTGEIFVLERGSSGNFEFGDPALGNEKHHAKKHRVEMATIEEAITAIENGFHPRMKGLETGQENMISPANIKIVEVPK